MRLLGAGICPGPQRTGSEQLKDQRVEGPLDVALKFKIPKRPPREEIQYCFVFNTIRQRLFSHDFYRQHQQSVCYLRRLVGVVNCGS